MGVWGLCPQWGILRGEAPLTCGTCPILKWKLIFRQNPRFRADFDSKLTPLYCLKIWARYLIRLRSYSRLKFWIRIAPIGGTLNFLKKRHGDYSTDVGCNLYFDITYQFCVLALTPNDHKSRFELLRAEIGKTTFVATPLLIFIPHPGAIHAVW